MINFTLSKVKQILWFQGVLSCCFSIAKILKRRLDQWEPQKLMLPSVAMDGKDGNRLNLEKSGQFFHVLKLCHGKIGQNVLQLALPPKISLKSS